MKIWYERTVRNFINVPRDWSEKQIYEYLRENTCGPYDDLTWWYEGEGPDEDETV